MILKYLIHNHNIKHKKHMNSFNKLYIRKPQKFTVRCKKLTKWEDRLLFLGQRLNNVKASSFPKLTYKFIIFFPIKILKRFLET